MLPIDLHTRIIRDVNSITNQHLIHQLFDYVQKIKRTPKQAAPNREAVLRFAGTITDAEANDLRDMLSKEFGYKE